MSSFATRLNSLKTRGVFNIDNVQAGRGRRPSTIDKSKPNVIDVTCPMTEIEWEGYLYKQSKIVKTWIPRYITLKDGLLCYYKSKKHAVERTQLRGSWQIAKVLDTIPSGGIGGGKLHSSTLGFSIVATNNHIIHFVAISPTEKEMWLHMFRKCCEQDSYQKSLATEQTTSTNGESKLARSSSQLFFQGLTEPMTGGPVLFEKLATILSDITPTELMDVLPIFVNHLSQDVDVKFDFEPLDCAKYGFSQGMYYAREGFVHFVSLFRQTFALQAANSDELPKVYPMKDVDSVEVVGQHVLLKLNTTEEIRGRFVHRMQFSPSGRIARMSVDFKVASSSSSGAARTRPRSLYKLEKHPQNFHLCYKSKRSLLLSFRDFEILGVLGQGGFGTVVLVQRFTGGELFAIKVVDKSAGASSALKERRILSTLRHPFLARLRFAFQTQTKLFLGLDFYTGGNLYYHMHSSTNADGTTMEWTGGRRMDIARVRFYAAELALAISYLHSHGIIYRDLKPDNVMLDDVGHIRLVDFGISKQLMKDEYTGTLAGSPAYIAPEQLNTQRPQYGTSADWWSWGVLVYEMLTGSTPFEDSNMAQMYRKIQSQDIRYDFHWPVEPAAIDLLRKVLVRDPSERPSFGEIQSHPFFDGVDWIGLLQKTVHPPFTPSTDDVFAHVSTHFAKMSVDSLDNTPCVGVGLPSTSTKKGDAVDLHIDDFSFFYEKPDEVAQNDYAYALIAQVKETFAREHNGCCPPSSGPTLTHLHSEDDMTVDNDLDPEVDLVVRDTEIENSLSRCNSVDFSRSNSADLSRSNSVDLSRCNSVDLTVVAGNAPDADRSEL
ncbi:AGC protein kinase [Saprolegnia diclina VS20]|uniref:AGC protein kinase n=1 Tax=Saprolegnia diclina (strain VS20) TaxID=1156394 RepID=T0S5Z9_SAPDV|nr:AGC protein kinase [Saprolegnia diclina VS20]EQC40508.1 AGC protein kinase [Saprolegnia diclina VS20]|eukprot:XP_008606207.1 AGC protein kinase [Saprolegnia diclina VS20]